MLIDIGVEENDTTLFATAPPSNFVDAVSTIVGADRLTQLKYADCDHLIVVRQSSSAGSIMGLASISVTTDLLGANERRIVIKEALIKENFDEVGDIILQEVRKMGQMMSARILCSEPLLSQAFPHILKDTLPGVTLRELR